MNILNTLTLNSNRKVKINFDGGNLSSDSGMLLIHEFATKLGLEAVLQQDFSTEEYRIRKHTDSKNAMQKIYQLIAGYFQDDDSDELTADPVFTTILDKKLLLHSLLCPGLQIGVMKSVYISLNSFIKNFESGFTHGKNHHTC